MGKAFVVPGADYSQLNLGTVTPSGSVPATSITITGPSIVNSSAKFGAVILPIFTTQRSVVWSITDGGNYATIDQNGRMTVVPGTSSESVTLKCQSSDNSELYATKTVTVSAAEIVYKDFVQTDGTDFILMPGLSAQQNVTLTVRVTLAGTNTYSFMCKNGTLPNISCYADNSNLVAAGVGSTSQKFGQRQTNIVYRFVFNCGTSNANDASLYIYNDKTSASIGSKTGLRFYMSGLVYVFRWGEGAAGSSPTLTGTALTPVNAKFYGMTVVNSSNVTVADYRPCTYNNVPGIYDTVSNVFRGGYLDTGGITAGNDE